MAQDDFPSRFLVPSPCGRCPAEGDPPPTERKAPTAATANPDHHLWRNGRLWWVAFTVHLPSWRKERIRLSLGTANVFEARRRRDRILRDYPLARDCELSLRIEARRGRTGQMGPSREVAA